MQGIITHCNTDRPMGKLWMLPVITLASESVKGFDTNFTVLQIVERKK